MSRNATIVVERMDGGPRLVIEWADALAHDFFTKDASSIGVNAYDRMAGQGGDPDRITTKDVLAINTTMRARSPHSAWEALTGAPEPLPWQWPSLRPLIEEALTASVGQAAPPLSGARQSRRAADRRRRPSADRARRAPPPRGRKNELPLATVSGALAKLQINRSLVRILDALLWASHPATGLASQLRTWEHRIKTTG